MRIYQYHHIDCKTPSNKESYKLYEDFNSEWLTPKQIRRKYLREKQKVRKLFKNAGWEGDGRIGLIWIPPFVIRNADTWGEIVWHVKQSNNGTSFIATSDYSNFNIYNYCD